MSFERPYSLIVALVSTTVLAGALGCSSKCAEIAATVDPVIHVADAKTGTPLCDATIIARSQDSTFSLRLGPASDAGTGCAYSLRASGTFTLDVSHAGYAPKSVENVASRSSDPCNGVPLPSAQVVNVSLDPAP